MAHPPNYKSDLLPKQCLSAALRESDCMMQGSLLARWRASVEEVTAWEVKTVRIAASWHCFKVR